MSLSSRVHQLKLINIPPHAGDVLPARRAAGQATAEHNNGRRSSGSRSPGQQVRLAGSRGGRSVVLALPAHILCRQSGVVYKLIAEGIWLETEPSTLHSVLRERRVGCRADQWGAIHCVCGGKYPSYPLTHTLSREQRPNVIGRQKITWEKPKAI